MLLSLLTLFTANAGWNFAAACTVCTNESPEPITFEPAPWTLKGTIYSFFLLPGLGISLSGNLPAKAFPPLERQYPESIAGDFKGLLGMVQIIRYTESPVGPYDELLIVPGFFGYKTNKRSATNVRVSRIYVSQKYTAWNGRENWNIPKHLARFDWVESPDGGASAKIYPFDTSGDPSESYPSSRPWFQMKFSPLLSESITNISIPFILPNGIKIPFRTDLYALLGINATLVQPPVPQGNDAYGALGTGGPYWRSVIPGQFSDKTSIGTINLDQSGGDGEQTGVNAVGDEFYPNFWPGMLSATVGLKMEESTITFSEPEIFT